jgi:hypothetical protein
VKSAARPDQPIAFTRCRREALSIECRDVPSAARDQTGAFELSGSIRNGWPLNTQHFSEQVLSDLQCVIVTAVSHHEQPMCQPLLEIVRTVARHGYQDLLEKGLDVRVHEALEGRYRPHG